MSDKEKKKDEGVPAILAKIDEIVGKVVPERFLPTALAGGAVLAVLFLILTIVGFARSPEAVAEKALDQAQATLDAAKKAQADLAQQLGAANTATKEMERRAVAAERSAQKLEAQQASALESQKKLQEQYDQERAKHAEARKEIQQASGQKRDVDGQLRNLQAALDKSKRETEAVQNARANVEKQLAQLNAQYVELQKERDERTKVDDRARTAFDNIMKTVGAIEDPAKKLDTLQKLSGAAAADLAGTAYRNRLDTEVARARDVLADHLAKAQKQEARAAKETYADAMRQAQMAATHDAAMEILAKAKAEVSGSPFELNIHNEMQRRADENVQLVAKNAYEQTMKQIRDKPIEYDANIAAINESMEKTKGTRYEALMQKQLTIVTGQRMEAIGKSYYTQAQAQIDKSPTDYASNVAVLRELVAKANGGRYEASIRKLLTKQEAYLAKSQKK